MYIFIVLIVVSSLNTVRSDICVDIDYHCDACMGNSFGCVWCADEVHNDTTRCRLENNPMVTSSWCKKLVNPPRNLVTFLEKDDPRTTDQEFPLSLFPPIEINHHVSIKARPNHKAVLNWFHVSGGESIDLYSIFDNSEFAKVYIEELKSQAPKIYDSLKDTVGSKSGIRFGVGTFDKANSDVNIFKNNLALTDDISKFVDYLEESENKIDLKDILEGLKQALESKEVTWNSDLNARRIIMIFCDPISKTLNEDEIQAYIIQINELVSSNGVNVIFTGFKNFQDEYNKLVEKIRGSTYLQLKDLGDDKDLKDLDLANAINEEFKKIAETIELDFGLLPSHIKITTRPLCKAFGQRCIIQSSYGSQLMVRITVHFKNCPKYSKYNNVLLTMTPIGSQKKLIIDTEIGCRCECSKIVDVKSLRCNSLGDYSCGICICIEGRYGDSCECVGNRYEEFFKCFATDDDYFGCNGHGNCVCGTCVCHDGYYGKLCTLRNETTLASSVSPVEEEPSTPSTTTSNLPTDHVDSTDKTT